MTSINLLPWREELRDERKKSFLASLVVVIILAALLLLGVDRFFNASIENQKARNVYMTQQIAILDKQIEEIRDLQSQKEELAARMAVIQNLQGTRPVIVRLFDQLARTLPDRVYYTRVSRTGNAIRLEGTAESNDIITELMRELNNSEWFASADVDQLTTIVSGADGGVAEIGFDMTIQITRPDQVQTQEELP